MDARAVQIAVAYGHYTQVVSMEIEEDEVALEHCMTHMTENVKCAAGLDGAIVTEGPVERIVPDNSILSNRRLKMGPYMGKVYSVRGVVVYRWPTVYFGNR